MTDLHKTDYLSMVMSRLPSLMSKDLRLHIACQFALESNFGTSNLAVTQCNHCGMKLAQTRLSTRLADDDLPRGCNMKFASYGSMKDCIVDYLLWLDYARFTQYSTISDWYELLPRYCPDDGYVRRVEAIYDYAVIRLG